MKYAVIFSLTFLVFLLDCKHSKMQSGEQVNKDSKATLNELQAKDIINNTLSPTAIEDCVSKVESDYSIDYDLEINPFYLRLNFDGNHKTDYALRVKSKTSQIKGLLICVDGKKPFIFGGLAKSKIPLTDIENDNFLTNNWDVVTQDEIKKSPQYTWSGKNRESAAAKGEALVFIFPVDGVQYIYWNGKDFRSFGEQKYICRGVANNAIKYEKDKPLSELYRVTM